MLSLTSRPVLKFLYHSRARFSVNKITELPKFLKQWDSGFRTQNPDLVSSLYDTPEDSQIHDYFKFLVPQVSYIKWDDCFSKNIGGVRIDSGRQTFYLRNGFSTPVIFTTVTDVYDNKILFHHSTQRNQDDLQPFTTLLVPSMVTHNVTHSTITRWLNAVEKKNVMLLDALYDSDAKMNLLRLEEDSFSLFKSYLMQFTKDINKIDLAYLNQLEINKRYKLFYGNAFVCYKNDLNLLVSFSFILEERAEQFKICHQQFFI